MISFRAALLHSLDITIRRRDITAGDARGRDGPRRQSAGADEGFIVEVLRGVVSSIRRSAAVWGNKEGVGTSQILTCQIGRQAVEIKMEKMPVIEEGDDLIVAGDINQGTLVAKAYRNLNNGTNGRWSYNVYTIVSFAVGAAIFALLTLVMICVGLTMEPTTFCFALVCGFGAVAFSIVALRDALLATQTKQAYQAVLREVQPTDKVETGAVPS